MYFLLLMNLVLINFIKFIHQFKSRKSCNVFKIFETRGAEQNSCLQRYFLFVYKNRIF